MKKFFKEFKTFITRGNIFDMAVGLIIATAFNKIVSSLVNDIIMPLVTWGTGAASLADLSIVLRRNAEGVATLTWAYGNFIQTIIDFLIIAFSIFLMVKVVTASQKKFKEVGNYVKNQSKKEVKAELEKTNNVDAAAYVGTLIAKRAMEKGINEVVYDRGGFIYQGKVAALAEAAREAGLVF